MKVEITRYRTYHKQITVEVEIDAESTDDKELLDKIMVANDEVDDMFDDLFADITHEEGLPSDEDRYDIDDESGTKIYGGHI